MMIGSPKNLVRLVLLATASGSVVAASAQNANAIPKVISQLEGSWRGSGVASPSKGARERISCRATYDVVGPNIRQSINCAGADYRINVRGRLSIKGATISGSWQESHFNYSGGASGTVRGDTIFLRIRGVNFNGRATMKVSSRGQTVTVSQYDATSKRYRNVANITLHK